MDLHKNIENWGLWYRDLEIRPSGTVLDIKITAKGGVKNSSFVYVAESVESNECYYWKMITNYQRFFHAVVPISIF